MTLSKSRKELTSDNTIFKLRLQWSLGLRVGFRRGISADNPFGVQEHNNVRRKPTCEELEQEEMVH